MGPGMDSEYPSNTRYWAIEYPLLGHRIPFHEPSTGLGRASQGHQCSLRRGDISVDLTDLRTRI